MEPKVHYRIHKSRSLVPILSQVNVAHCPFVLRSILILPSCQSLGLPSVLFPSVFLTKTLYLPLLSPYMPHVPPISFFLIRSPERWRSSSICRLLQSPVTCFTPRSHHLPQSPVTCFTPRSHHLPQSPVTCFPLGPTIYPSPLLPVSP